MSVDSLITFTDDGTYSVPAINMILISNLPQLILSLLYTAVNGMWTAMLVGDEWNSYGIRRKGLRTTYPVGHQRKTYWLSLPLVRAISSTSGHANNYPLFGALGIWNSSYSRVYSTPLADLSVNILREARCL